ncbi:unnamed protein product [Clonostachys rosea f. rosea IK726]|uniref:Zn(2)-C6 fungal-type domain-containing protein n=2 Tax=Bionectria ochroleuca TaxID=29856 RepID=A0A0B7KE60_BIOOC|nr:unnamed protein product [Clonostachys rosea f. rosea IK726]
MAEPQQRPEFIPSRRNLPRASHACQRCRVKKAKCDQRQPCANCIKHSHECTYGLRRRNARDRNKGALSSDRDCVPFQPSTLDGGDESPRRSGMPEHAHGLDRLVFAPQSLPVGNADVMGDVNQHTQGTEFYGTSSNFVLLSQFFAYAQQHLPPRHSSSSNCNEGSYLSLASSRPSGPSSAHDQNSPWTSDGVVSGPGLPTRSPLSIVNLLHNNEALEPPSRPKTQTHVAENQQGVPEDSSLALSRTRNGSYTGLIQDGIPTLHQQHSLNGESGRNLCSSAHPATKERPVPERSLHAAQKRLEREYVRLCLSNLHHIHPMLDPIALAARCEDEIWNVDAPLETNKGLRNFLALYYIVVAIGALGATAGISQHFERDIKMCMKECPNSSLPVSSQSLSTKYFRKSRALLGDVFEVCSLESAQTLHLMSIYCQNALKPHACYLYCGHAVRTALAIGITRESMSNSIEDRKAARRTWWCIYSHEIEMSCNAGRRDSLGKPRNYQIDLPRIRAQSSSVPDGSELENCSVAMINEMAHFAAVLRRISKKLYYDSKGLTMLQKSVVAQELDTLLDDWKGQLPTYLDFGSVSFREEEWAAKQKLVLHLRYLHAKIVLHRPFLEAPMSGTTTRMSRHVDSCLEAARDTIRVIYDAYTNRHYFRTWWYNSTYTLYAGMIVLYVVILGQAAVSSNELLDDVVKAQDILQSMEEAIVARRSANLIREGLEVAQACIQNQQNQSARHEGTESEQEHDASPGQSDLNNMASQAGSEFSRTLFSHAVPGQDPALLASIVDPNLLRDFTAAEDMSGLEFPMFPFEGYGLDADPT